MGGKLRDPNLLGPFIPRRSLHSISHSFASSSACRNLFCIYAAFSPADIPPNGRSEISAKQACIAGAATLTSTITSRYPSSA